MLDVFDNEKGLCNFFATALFFLLLNGISASITTGSITTGSITTGSIIAGSIITGGFVRSLTFFTSFIFFIFILGIHKFTVTLGAN